MAADVWRYVTDCPKCQVNKSSHQRPQGLLQPLQIPDSRWQVVTLDFITGLPRSQKGHDAILVFVDKLSKMIHLTPCRKTCGAAETAHLLFNEVIRHHGVPEQLISDRDPRLTSDYWKTLCQSLDISIGVPLLFILRQMVKLR